MQTSQFYVNAHARRATLSRPSDEVRRFHAGLPGYAPTPLLELPEVAEELGVARVVVKDESSRLGLPAFKILGASYAIARALSARWGSERTLSLAELRELAPSQPPVTLFAATDGNHGRAVARTAALIGLDCQVFYPGSLTAAAMAAIAAEGALTTRVELPYDDVVQTMRDGAAAFGAAALVVQDTSWHGYTDIPGWIVDGYSTMLAELDDQLHDLGIARVDLALAPAGVGSLAQAIVAHFKSGSTSSAVTIVEPLAAPAVFHALTSGSPAPVSTTDTVMLGLNCGTVSELAWPVLRAGADAAVLVSDDEARAAVATLGAAGVDAGPCGAATLAGARRILASARAELSLSSSSTVVLFNTESLSANPL